MLSDRERNQINQFKNKALEPVFAQRKTLHTLRRKYVADRFDKALKQAKEHACQPTIGELITACDDVLAQFPNNSALKELAGATKATLEDGLNTWNMAERLSQPVGPVQEEIAKTIDAAIDLFGSADFRSEVDKLAYWY